MDTITIEARPNEATTYYFEAVRNGEMIGRARLIVAHNGLHKEPFGLIEDLNVTEAYQNQGVGTKLLNKVILKAKDLGCYKLTCTSRLSRKRLHIWYEKIGFTHTSKGFRMNLE